MTLIAVAIPVDDASEVDAAIETSHRAAADGASLVEWRIDALLDRMLPGDAAGALHLVRRLVGGCRRPSIVTVRSAAEGGEYRGDDASRVAFLEALGAGDPAPRYIDLELAAFERSANLRQKIRLAVQHDRQPRDLKTSLILSTHDFESRPADLQSRLARMIDEPACAVAKLAWRARSLRDDLEAFELLHERRSPTIALCMGEFGLLSRILAPKFGGFLSFARAEGGTETAAGQPTVRELIERWRFRRIGADTEVYGVIGWPVGQSRSPDVHNAGFDAIGRDAIHLPMPIEGSWESFKATVGAMIECEALSFRGASVTIPHKEHLVRFVRERGGALCPISERCGSANTLVVTRLEGPSGAPSLAAFNTDAPAALAVLEGALRHRDERRRGGRRLDPGRASGRDGAPNGGVLRGLRVALLGAGGTARALVPTLADAGAVVSVFNRTRDRAESLARTGGSGESGGVLVGGTLDDLAHGRSGAFDAVVNTTSVGMAGGPAPERSPLPDAFSMHEEMIVMDLVHRPRDTPLLRAARAAGAIAVDGLDMFVRQAEAQFRLWCATPPPDGVFAEIAPREVAWP